MDISRGRGIKALRWAAPVGAIAAGLLIWFVTQTNPPVNKVQMTAQSGNVRVAQEQPRNEQLTAPRALPISPPAEAFTKTKRLNELRKDNSRTKQPATESGTPGATSSSVSDSIASRAELEAGVRTSDANAPTMARESGDHASRTAAEEKRPDISSREADVSVTAAAPAPAVSGDTQAGSGTPASEAAKTAAKQRANANASQTVETNSNRDFAQRVAAMDNLALAQTVKEGDFENAKIILAPKGKRRWRLLPAGRIERSSDGGVSWLAQDSRVNVELLAGSAPSESVCWIVGRGGTILKTTDGGSHWRKVASPDAGDISGIEASDAMHAIVYDVTAVIPARLATNDGGLRWFRTNK